MRTSARLATSRRALVAALVLAVCGLAASVNAPPAAAAPPAWTPPSLPGGSVDPFDAFTKPAGQGYSSADLSRILRDRVWYSGQVAPNSALTTTQQLYYRKSRLYRLKTLLRLAPKVTALTNGLKFVCGPVSPLVCAAGAVAVGGYIAYEVTSDPDARFPGEPSLQSVVAFRRDQIGGTAVIVPAASTGAVEGTDWIASTDVPETTTATSGTFGWVRRTNLTTSVVPGGAGWVFEYTAFPATGFKQYGLSSTCANGGDQSGCYPKLPASDSYSGSNTVVRRPPGVVADATCSADTTACWGTNAGSSSGYKRTPYDVPALLQQAANLTLDGLDGALVPLPVTIDADAYASGHLLPTSSTTCTGSSSMPTCRVAYTPETVMERSAATELETSPSDADTVATAPAYTVPATAGNDADRQAVADDETPCFRAMFNELVDPVNYSYAGCSDPKIDADLPTSPAATPLVPATYVLPAPLPNETATAYRTRLQALGHLGTITLTEGLLTEGYGPLSPTRITVTQTSPASTRVFDPLTIPAGTVVKTDATIQIRHNPATASEVPTEGGGVPDAPALDFSPITEIDWGCKFPVGFVCYAIDVSEWFNVTPDAPVFALGDVCVTPPAGGELCAGPYTVDLNVMDDYMSLLRSLMSVALWIGTVYLLATRLLGFRAGGDPGEAVDEGLEWR